MVKQKHDFSDVFIITKQFNTAEEFSTFIELQAAKGGHNYIECITDFCERNHIEIEAVPKLVTKTLKAKIRNEAEERKLIKRKASPKLL